MLQTFETAVREVAFWAVLATGCLCLIGGAVAIAGWVIKRMIKTFGLYRDFMAFARSRRRGR